MSVTVDDRDVATPRTNATSSLGGDGAIASGDVELPGAAPQPDPAATEVVENNNNSHSVIEN